MTTTSQPRRCHTAAVLHHEHITSPPLMFFSTLSRWSGDICGSAVMRRYAKSLCIVNICTLQLDIYMCTAGHLETVGLSLSAHLLTRGEFSGLLVLRLELASFPWCSLAGWKATLLHLYFQSNTHPTSQRPQHNKNGTGVQLLSFTAAACFAKSCLLIWASLPQTMGLQSYKAKSILDHDTGVMQVQ